MATDLNATIAVSVPAANGTIAPLGKWTISPQIADGAPPGPPAGTIVLTVSASTSVGVRSATVRADDAALNSALSAISATLGGIGAQQALSAILLAIQKVTQPVIEASMRAGT